MISVQNLSFSYGEQNIFDRFSAEFSGSVTCLEGPSGCGKTTLLRLIAGLIKPDSGGISGVPLRISFLFQEDRLLPWLTAEENVQAVLPNSKKEAAAVLLGSVELAGEAGKLPENLSGGQRRRVALARALAYESGLLLLDEPFKGLDPALTARLVPLILSKNVPIIMTSHSREEAALMGGETLRLAPK